MRSRHKQGKPRPWFLGILVILCIAAVLFLLCARSVLFEQIIFSQLGTEISDERAVVSTEVRSYLWKSIPLSEELFTQRERAHLSDVKQLFDLQRDFTAMVLAVTLLLVVAFRPSAQRLWHMIVSVSRISFLVALILAAIIFFNFDFLFSGFHVVSFANDFWQLDPSVHVLIRAYPPEYFRLFVVYWLALLLMIYGAIGFLFSRFRQTTE